MNDINERENGESENENENENENGNSLTNPMSDLQALEAWSMDQDDLERDVAIKATEAMAKRDNELDIKRLEKTEKSKKDFENRISKLEERLLNPNVRISQKEEIRHEIKKIEEVHLKSLNQDLLDIRNRMAERKDEVQTTGVNPSTSGRLKGESQHDYLVRTGKITPFAKGSNFTIDSDRPMSHQNLTVPGMELDDEETEDEDIVVIERNKKKRKTEAKVEAKPIKITLRLKRDMNRESENENTNESKDAVITIDSDSEEVQSENSDQDQESDGYIPDNESIPDENEQEVNDEEYDDYDNDNDNDNYNDDNNVDDYSSKKRKRKPDDFAGMDDGNELVYRQRLNKWITKRKAYRKKFANSSIPDDEDDEITMHDLDEWKIPHPTFPDAVLDNEFKIPGDVYASLFDYQRTGVQWLWELYCQKTGGIIGDEMGLGKTIQIVSFIAGLHYSGKLDKPVLVVCPATVMKQWVNEFHRWWPALRVVILHSIGSGMDPSKEQQIEEALTDINPDEPLTTGEIKKRAGAKALVDKVMKDGHVLITTYVGMRIYSKYIAPKKWGYCVLDEGHKIRNPDSDISLKCKQVKTANRIILSGTPIQNNLTELWSLFDFVFPGRLGTLPVFQNQFSIPINVGGYANATNVQVQTAYKCAVVLRDIISPYMLRRMKVDVAADLPKKSEKVLFCKLTKIQNDGYVNFLKSNEMKSILAGKRQVLFGVDILRKICNHPDLVNRDVLLRDPDYEYGLPNKSGKMQVVKALVELWKSQEHRTLLFCQTRQMLDILEKFLNKLEFANGGYIRYLRMDGSTPIANRQGLVDTFNNDVTYDVFLLTTKVGGLGVNLTGADRVIIYDPDWNPSTDVQARERAWRLGQKKDVVIFRLMTAGAIEEKIYHRQIFKQFLTNKILKDPKQRRFFKMNDLHDLFTLGESESGTETGGMFSGTERNVRGDDDNGNKKDERTDQDDLSQLSSIGGVAGLENFRTGNESNTEQQPKDNEENILEGIFAKSGVQSTLEHDAIMEASRPDTILVEREATRVATQAANALRESRKETRKAQIGTPTWTGRFGSAGRLKKSASSTPSRSSRNSSPRPPSMSSSSILQSIREKRELEEKERATVGTENDSVSHRTEILKKMVNYLNNQPNKKAKSASILRSSNVHIDDVQEVATIRQMLKEIAIWDGKESVWTLKEEFH